MPIVARPDDNLRPGASVVTLRDIPAQTPELRREQVDRELSELREAGRTVAALIEHGRLAATAGGAR